MKQYKFFKGYIYTQIQTSLHKMWVFWYICKFCFGSNYNRKIPLLLMAILHDLSKYSWVEAKGFSKTIFDLKSSTYGSEEYNQLLAILKPCLSHHYSKNPHHPEFYKNGFKEMPEIRKIEMVADWMAATKRHHNGNIYDSLEINQKRFGYSNEDKMELKAIVEIMRGNFNFLIQRQ